MSLFTRNFAFSSFLIFACLSGPFYVSAQSLSTQGQATTSLVGDETRDREGASDDENESSISLLIKADSDHSTDSNIDMEFPIAKKTSLGVGFEKSDSTSSQSPTENLDTKEFRIGVSRDVSDVFSFTVDYAVWGQANVVTSNTLSLPLRWILDDWSINFTPGERLISFYIIDAAQFSRVENGNVPSRFNINDPYLTASLKFRGWRPWSLKLSGGAYSYSRKLDALNSPKYANFFSGSALTLANNFESSEFGAELAYSFKIVKVGASYVNSASAINGTNSPVTTLKSDWTVSNHWEIEGNVGVSPPPSGESRNVTFLALGTTYSW